MTYSTATGGEQEPRQHPEGGRQRGGADPEEKLARPLSSPESWDQGDPAPIPAGWDVALASLGRPVVGGEGPEWCTGSPALSPLLTRTQGPRSLCAPRKTPGPAPARATYCPLLSDSLCPGSHLCHTREAVWPQPLVQIPTAPSPPWCTAPHSTCHIQRQRLLRGFPPEYWLREQSPAHRRSTAHACDCCMDKRKGYNT